MTLILTGSFQSHRMNAMQIGHSFLFFVPPDVLQLSRWDAFHENSEPWCCINTCKFTSTGGSLSIWQQIHPTYVCLMTSQQCTSPHPTLWMIDINSLYQSNCYSTYLHLWMISINSVYQTVVQRSRSLLVDDWPARARCLSPRMPVCGSAAAEAFEQRLTGLVHGKIYRKLL